jgi:hypothetical protein
MFDAAESIGSEAAEYLSQLGYTYTVIGVYVGPEVDVEAVHDDRNPNHSELLEEYHEHLITCLEYTEDFGEGEILIEWSEGTVRSHNESVKPEVIERLKEFHDQMMLQFESVDESE